MNLFGKKPEETPTVTVTKKKPPVTMQDILRAAFEWKRTISTTTGQPTRYEPQAVVSTATVKLFKLIETFEAEIVERRISKETEVIEQIPVDAIDEGTPADKSVTGKYDSHGPFT